MKQKEIDWQFDEDCQEWTGKLDIFEFHLLIVFGYWRAKLIEPFHLNFDGRGYWSNSPAAKCLSLSIAKEMCEGYISDRLSEMTEC